jgi:hypothetical protein
MTVKGTYPYIGSVQFTGKGLGRSRFAGARSGGPTRRRRWHGTAPVKPGCPLRDRDAIEWHQLAGSRLSKTLGVRQGLRNHLNAVALMDKTPPCSSIQPDPESGPVGHPFVQDGVKRGTATVLEADATSGWNSFRSCNPHIAPLKGLAIIGGGYSLTRRTRRKARESFSFCQRSVLPSADRLDWRRQPLHKKCFSRPVSWRRRN